MRVRKLTTIDDMCHLLWKMTHMKEDWADYVEVENCNNPNAIITRSYFSNLTLPDVTEEELLANYKFSSVRIDTPIKDFEEKIPNLKFPIVYKTDDDRFFIRLTTTTLLFVLTVQVQPWVERYKDIKEFYDRYDNILLEHRIKYLISLS